MSRLNIADVHCEALAYNLARVRQCAPKAKILAMIKANAYGHGVLAVAKALMNADAFGVASVEEALVLREAGIQKSIVLMAGFFEQQELEIIVRERLSAVLQNDWQIQMIESERISQPMDVWVKVNTGMNRLGFDAKEARSILNRLRLTRKIREIGLLSHLSDADDLNSDKTQRQINAFRRLTAEFDGPKSLANSAAILKWPDAHLDWVRPGSMLYGFTTFGGEAGVDQKLKPAMTLRSRIIAIHDVKAGEAIGYGSRYTADRDMKVGVVCMGYGDGYPRHAKSGTPTLINGVSCPIVGRVSMDMLSVELKTQARLHDEVILWGEGLPIEIIAQHSGTIPLELVSKLTSRVRLNVIERMEASDVSLA